MARPRLNEQERRARTVGVRVTTAEAAELRERAQAARLSMGAYLRRRALGQRVRMAAELRLGAAELRELRGTIGTAKTRDQPREKQFLGDVIVGSDYGRNRYRRHLSRSA